MKMVESDSESVESGSCTCSDYDSDCSWFYDSRKLQTSFMRFNIIGESKNYNFIKKQLNSIKKQDLQNNINNYNSNKDNKIKIINLNSNSNIKYKSRSKNIIKITRRSPYERADIIRDDHIDKSKIPSNKARNYKRRKNNETIDFTFTNLHNNINDENIVNIANKTFNTKHSFSKKLEKNEFFKKEKDIYEQNNNFPNENFYLPINTIKNGERSPFIRTKIKKSFNISNDNVYKTAKKQKPQTLRVDSQRGINSPKKNYNNSFNINNENKEDTFLKNINNTNIKSNRNKNSQTRGITIKEKIIKETKNIILDPGQSIKPQTTTRRKLKPIIKIIKNDDGSQNMITENTTLTTITKNEIIDSSKLYDDKYPLDVQIVKQYITKIYKTEIENNPYIPK